MEPPADPYKHPEAPPAAVPPPPYAPPAAVPPPPYAPPAYSTAAQVPTMQQPPSMAEQLIPTKNPMALAGYYTGVFSLIPCFGLIIGPIALVLGMLAFKALKQNPTLPGKGHAIAALVMGGLSTALNWGVVLFILIAGLTARP